MRLASSFRLRAVALLAAFFALALVAPQAWAAPSTPSDQNVTRVEIEANTPNMQLSLPVGNNIRTEFVRETERMSSGGAHLKTQKVGASVTYKFVGTGIRFLTKKGSGAGKVAITVDAGPAQEVDEYKAGAPSFQTVVFEKLNLSATDEPHTIKVQVVKSDHPNVNFDAFDVIKAPAPVIPPTVSAGNTTYYVDANAQKGGDGTSQQHAFKTLAQVNAVTYKPGDSILFRRGTSYQGVFAPQGSGSAQAPVKVAAYGAGAPPFINGAGRAPAALPAYGANGPFGADGSAVYLHNQNYWDISGLHVSNPGQKGVDKDRSGVRVEASGGGTYRGIHIHHLLIDNVGGFDGQYQTMQVNPANGGKTFFVSRVTHRTGGINIVSYTRRGAQPADKSQMGPILDPSQTRFDGVEIDHNVIRNVSANGITTTNVNGSLDNRANRDLHVNIHHNTITGVTRSGIIPLYTSDAHVHHNVISDFQSTRAGYGCGIWADRADGLKIEYNEVSNGRNTNDGMAFNLDDMTENGLVQYNYSHNNVGGGFMLHVRSKSYNRNNTIRYNVSVNDASHYAPSQAIVVAIGEDKDTKIQNARVYNNTFINHRKVHPVYMGDQVSYTNNIFYLTDPGLAQAADAWHPGPHSTFKNNLFAGAAGMAAPQSIRAGSLSAADPGFAGKLDGTQTVRDEAADSGARMAGVPASQVGPDGAKLKKDSPAYKKGIAVPGAVDLGVDAWGNDIAKRAVLNIGAYQGDAVDEEPSTATPTPKPSPDMDHSKSDADQPKSDMDHSKSGQGMDQSKSDADHSKSDQSMDHSKSGQGMDQSKPGMDHSKSGQGMDQSKPDAGHSKSGQGMDQSKSGMDHSKSGRGMDQSKSGMDRSEAKSSMDHMHHWQSQHDTHQSGRNDASVMPSHRAGHVAAGQHLARTGASVQWPGILALAGIAAAILLALGSRGARRR